MCVHINHSQRFGLYWICSRFEGYVAKYSLSPNIWYHISFLHFFPALIFNFRFSSSEIRTILSSCPGQKWPVFTFKISVINPDRSLPNCAFFNKSNFIWDSHLKVGQRDIPYKQLYYIFLLLFSGLERWLSS